MSPASPPLSLGAIASFPRALEAVAARRGDSPTSHPRSAYADQISCTRPFGLDSSICSLYADHALSAVEPLPYLTQRQALVLRVIDILRKDKGGKMPSVREIAARAGIRSSNPAVYTDPLRKKGYMTAGKARVKGSIQLTAKAEQWLELYRHSDPRPPVRKVSPRSPQLELPINP